MKIAHDIYAETNPAYCALALATFVSSYRSVNQTNTPLTAAYLALPIFLSNDLTDSFSGTNEKTGLSVWIDRHPATTIDFPERINATLEITGEAIKFACFNKILSLNIDSSLSPGMKMPKQKQLSSISDEHILHAFKRAKVLGNWFARAGSIRAVLDTLGVSV